MLGDPRAIEPLKTILDHVPWYERGPILEALKKLGYTPPEDPDVQEEEREGHGNDPKTKRRRERIAPRAPDGGDE